MVMQTVKLIHDQVSCIFCLQKLCYNEVYFSRGDKLKKFLILILLLALAFIFPFKFLTLPDEWTLEAKDSAREFIKKQTDKKQIEVKSVDIGNIKLNMTNEEVDRLLGKPVRTLNNQFNDKWSLYHQSYKHFVMIGYLDDKVAALYSNDPNYIGNISVEELKKDKGEPLTVEEGKNYRAHLSEENILNYEDADVRSTYYYDQHDKRIDALMIVSERYFNQKKHYYAASTETLARSYEQVDYELINASRVKRGLPVLQYHDKISKTALQHSQNMADNHFFDHTNPQGETPFDRMTSDGNQYKRAGENLAAGQVSPIEAHHGLMNSEGHRANILMTSYKSVGIGVAFNEKQVPYYTENYITEK